MAIRIQYQNNVTGAAFDITTLVSGAKWSTKRSGSPASLELTAIVNDEIQWSHGGIVTLLDDKTGLFYGYVVKISQNEKEQVQITAYDQTWYLKNTMAQAQIEANKRFRKKSYDRIEITVPKGDREKIVQAASAAGMSVNAFIKEALAEYIAHTTKQ